jgi:hypothetical protein
VRRFSQCNNHKLTFTALQVVASDDVEEALNDSEYLELLNNLAHLPDLSIGKPPSQHGYSISSHSIQDSMAVLETNIVSTYVIVNNVCSWSVLTSSSVLTSIMVKELVSEKMTPFKCKKNICPLLSAKRTFVLILAGSKISSFSQKSSICPSSYIDLFLNGFTLNTCASYPQGTLFMSEIEFTDRLVTFLKILCDACTIIVGCLIYELYNFLNLVFDLYLTPRLRMPGVIFPLLHIS